MRAAMAADLPAVWQGKDSLPRCRSSYSGEQECSATGNTLLFAAQSLARVQAFTKWSGQMHPSLVRSDIALSRVIL